MRLSAEAKSEIVPLIEICPPEFDFETRQPAKSIDEHLEKFGRRIETKWGARPALVDGGLIDPSERMANGDHPFARILAAGRSVGANLIPVTGLERDGAYQAAVQAALQLDRKGVAIRATLDDFAGDFSANFDAVIKSIGVAATAVDIVFDLGSPNFEPLDGLASLVVNILKGHAEFEVARSVIVTASAFPGTMGDIAGPVQLIPRSDWLLYKAILGKLGPGDRTPTFGDYAVAAPEIFSGDMRLLKPSANVRYAIDDAWMITKGNNVRDNGFEQYRGQCSRISSCAQYLGEGFSAGSKYIAGCGKGSEKTGNMTTWRWVGTNHHLTKVVSDLASLHGF